MIGGGSLLAVLVSVGLAIGRPLTMRRAASALLAMGVATALAPATALPAAALCGLEVTASLLAALPAKRLEAIALRRRPRAWIVGTAAASAAVVGAGVTGYWLAWPLIDGERVADERLAFAAAGGAPQAAAGAAGQVVAKGNLVGTDSCHFGSGSVRVLRAPDGQHLLRFADYAVRNGPDLFVYLTPDSGGDVKAPAALSIGMVKAARGAVNYELPAGVDAARFRSAVIWCESFDVVFAVARFQ